MNRLLFMLLLVLQGWSLRASAIVGPQEALAAVPSWLVRIYAGRVPGGEGALFCYGALIDPRWVVSSVGCLNDPYEVLQSAGAPTERQYTVRLGLDPQRVRVRNRYQSPDAGLMLYELDYPVAARPVAVSPADPGSLEGESVVILGLDSSEPLAHDYFNPDGSRGGSCTVNGRRFFDTGILCYVYTWPVRHSRMVKTEARIIDPFGPDRPDTGLDQAVQPKTDGSRLYLRYGKPTSYACIEDMGMPIVRITEGGKAELVGLVNAVGMAVGLPLCSASMAHWYTAVAHYRDFLVRARAEARFRAACPAQPTLQVDYPGQGRVELHWQSVAGATGYRLIHAPVEGRSDIRSLDVGSVESISLTLGPEEQYEVSLQAYGPDCTSPLSFPRFLQLPDETALINPL
jgi:hypothetical protein